VFFDPGGLNSTSGNNSSGKRPAPKPEIKPASNCRKAQATQTFPHTAHARKSNNSKPRGRAVALHECLTESRRISLLNLGFMETRVNDYHFGTLHSVAGNDDLGSVKFQWVTS